MSKWSNPDCKVREERKLLATTHRINVVDATGAAAKAAIGKQPKSAHGVRYIFNGWSEFCELSITKSSVKLSVITDFLGRKFFLSPTIASRLMFFKINSYPSSKSFHCTFSLHSHLVTKKTNANATYYCLPTLLFFFTVTLIESEVFVGDNVLVSLRECPQNVDLLLTYLIPPREFITKWTQEELEWRSKKERKPWEVDINVVKPLSTLGLSYLGDTLAESLAQSSQSQSQQQQQQQQAGQSLCCRVAGVLYALSMATRLPENVSAGLTEAHIKELVHAFSEVAGDSSLGVLVGHCLHIFANFAPHQFYWRNPGAGLHSRVATQPEASSEAYKEGSRRVTRFAADAGVFEVIGKVLETTYAHSTGQIKCLAADTLGALISGDAYAAHRFWNTSRLVATVRTLLGWPGAIGQSQATTQQQYQPQPQLKGQTQPIALARSLSPLAPTSTPGPEEMQMSEEVLLRTTLLRALSTTHGGRGIECNDISLENSKALEQFGIVNSAVDTILWGFQHTVRFAATHSPGGSETRRRAPPPPPSSPLCYAEMARELATAASRGDDHKSPAPKKYPLFFDLITGAGIAIKLAGQDTDGSVLDLFNKVFDSKFRVGSGGNARTRNHFRETSVTQLYFLEYIINELESPSTATPAHSAQDIKAAEGTVRTLFTAWFVGRGDPQLKKPIIQALCALARYAPAHMYLFTLGCISDYIRGSSVQQQQQQQHTNGTDACVFCVEAAVVLIAAYAADMPLLPGSASEELLDVLNSSRKIVSEDCPPAVRKDNRFPRIQKAYAAQAGLLLSRTCASAAMKGGSSSSNNLAYSVVFSFLRDPALSDAGHKAVIAAFAGQRTPGQELRELCLRYVEFLNNKGNTVENVGPMLRGIREICALSTAHATLFADTPVFRYILGCGMVLCAGNTPPQKAFIAASDLLKTLFCLLTSTKRGTNIRAFEDCGGYRRLALFLRAFFAHERAAGHTEYEAEVMGHVFNFMCNDASPAESPTALATPSKAPPGVPEIVNPAALVVITGLIPDLSSNDAATFVLDKLAYLLQSPRNRAICCHPSLDMVRRLLLILCRGRRSNSSRKTVVNSVDDSNIDDDDPTKFGWNPKYAEMRFDQTVTPKIVGVIQTLGGCRLSPQDLRFVLRILACSDPKSKSRLRVFPHFVEALRAIASPAATNIAPQLEPRGYYDFVQGRGTTEAGSGLILPPVGKGPFQKGLTFTAWMRVGKCGSGEYKPRIFGLFGEKDMGVELYMSDSFLTFHVVSQSEDENFSFSKFVVVERRWMFLSLTMSTGLLKSSEVRLYVDGALVERAPISYPRMSPYTKNSVGCALIARGEKLVPTQSFSGQIVSVNFFDDSLSLTQIQQIYAVGPNYLGLFNEAE